MVVCLFLGSSLAATLGSSDRGSGLCTRYFNTRAHVDEHNDLADGKCISVTCHIFPMDQHAGCNQISGYLILRDFVSQINQVLILTLLLWILTLIVKHLQLNDI